MSTKKICRLVYVFNLNTKLFRAKNQPYAINKSTFYAKKKLVIRQRSVNIFNNNNNNENKKKKQTQQVKPHVRRRGEQTGRGRGGAIIPIMIISEQCLMENLF